MMMVAHILPVTSDRMINHKPNCVIIVISLSSGIMHISRMFLHPVKALKSIEVSEATLGSYGFEYDRIYMLAMTQEGSDSYKFYSQRQDPRLVLVKTAIDDGSIVISYENHEFRLPANSVHSFRDAPTVSVYIFDTLVDCLDVTSQFDIYPLFSAVLGPSDARKLRLVAPSQRRTVPTSIPENLLPDVDHPLQFVFQDKYPVHLITDASFNSLKDHVDSQTDGSEGLEVQSFRPNMVVETDEPWVEDDWRVIRIGGTKFFVADTRERCPVPTVDVNQGYFRKSKEPYKSLSKFRILKQGERPSFGVDLVHFGRSPTVHVGDSVEVLESVA